MYTPTASLKQGLRVTADRIVSAKGLEHPIFGPFHPEEKVSPPVPEWLVRKYEAGTEKLEAAVKVDSQDVTQPVHSEADSLRDTPLRPLSQSDGKPLDTGSTLLEVDSLRDTPLRPLSQSDGKPLDTGSTLLPLVHRNTSDSEPVLLSQSDGEAQLAAQLPLSAGQTLGTPRHLLSESDGKQDAVVFQPHSQSHGKLQLPLSQGDGKPLSSSNTAGASLNAPLKPNIAVSPLPSQDDKMSLASPHTTATELPLNEVKFERASSPLWEYPGRPLDSEPNERLITIISKPFGEMKLLPDRYWRITHKGPMREDDDYDSDELLEPETGNVRDVTAMRPDPLGLMPKHVVDTMESGGEEALRSILNMSLFTRPPLTKIARKQMAALNYESTVRMSAALLPPSVVMMAERRVRRIIDVVKGSWCEPSDAVTIASELWGPPRHDFERASFHVRGEPLVDHDLTCAPNSNAPPSRCGSPWTTDGELEEQSKFTKFFVAGLRHMARSRKRTYSARSQMLGRKAKHGHLFKYQLDAAAADTVRRKGGSTRDGNTIIPNAVHPSLEERLFGEDLQQKRLRRSLREMHELISIFGVRRRRTVKTGRPPSKSPKRHRWDGRSRYPSFDADGNPYLPEVDMDSAPDVDDSEDEISSYEGEDEESDESDDDIIDWGTEVDINGAVDSADEGSNGDESADDGIGSDDSAEGSDDTDEDGDDTDEDGTDDEDTDEDATDDENTDQTDEETGEQSEADADAVDAAVSYPWPMNLRSFDDLLMYERAIHVHHNWPNEDPDAYDSEVESDRLSDRLTSSSSWQQTPAASASTRPSASEPANAVAGPSTAARQRGSLLIDNDDGVPAVASAQERARAGDSVEPPKKRRPGRPRKQMEADPSPASPKKRGRPPKDRAVGPVPPTSDEPPKKRKPGRPPKNKDEDTAPTTAIADPPPATSAETADEPPKTRGPGRPRKSEKTDPAPTTPKKRGRPPKDKGKGKQRADGEDEEEEEDELATPKQTRYETGARLGAIENNDNPTVPVGPRAGQTIDCILVPSRPHRQQPSPEVAHSDPAKVGQSWENPLTVSDEDIEEVTEPPPKRPRGRPPKNPVPEKKAEISTASADQLVPAAGAAPAHAEPSTASTSLPVTRQGPTWATHNGNTRDAVSATIAAEESMDELQDSEEVSVRRGPGRPKGSKNRPKPTAVVDEAAVVGEEPVKRKRGRPRKTDPGPVSDEPPVKRKRGRPRKTEPLPPPPAPAVEDTETLARRGPGRPKGSTNYASAIAQTVTARVTRSTPHASSAAVGQVPGSPFSRRSTRSSRANKAELAALYPAYYDAENMEDEFSAENQEGELNDQEEQRDERDNKDDDESPYQPDDDNDDDLYM
ncbi:hypothetical protein CspHIS471_0701860 [Cutaneotrichosporon sp. HIS471]|nr:hypothetical protein CspHIS471_0701860 [Cutaneotrichosporon sp. HIS471]